MMKVVLDANIYVSSLLTHSKAMPIQSYQGIAIVSPATFLAILEL